MIGERFSQLRERGESALIPYLTAGFPNLDRSLEILETIDREGADIVEVGIPFGDPVADGPTIQNASHQALQQGVTLDKILDGLAGLRLDAPPVVMSYLNPLMALGSREALLERLQTSRVGGLIVPDLPMEEADAWSAAAAAAGIDLILLAAPTSGPERLGRIAERCRGFLYYVTVTGTTGARRELPDDLLQSLRAVKAACPLPVAAGFGISTPEQVRELCAVVDGVVVGSRIVRAIEQQEPIEPLIRGLKDATRSAQPC